MKLGIKWLKIATILILIAITTGTLVFLNSSPLLVNEQNSKIFSNGDLALAPNKIQTLNQPQNLTQLQKVHL